MRNRYTFSGVVAKVEERAAKRWVRGVGKDAEFAEDSEGWYVVLDSWPAALHFGKHRPDISSGDRVKITVEAVAK